MSCLWEWANHLITTTYVILTAHSSQLTAHSSQLTAHGSRLTAAHSAVRPRCRCPLTHPSVLGAVHTQNVLASIRLMSNASYFGLSPSKITVSTVGVVPKILQLTREAPSVNLALSLHAPNQALRTQIVPTARAWKLDVLMDSIDDHMQRNKKRVLIEYIMLGRVNDSLETAHELGKLLSGRDVVCNLIPYNPVDLDNGREYEAPSEHTTRQFAQILRSTYGLMTTVRHEMGQEIGGACGQLAINGGKGCSTTTDSKSNPAGSTDSSDCGGGGGGSGSGSGSGKSVPAFIPESGTAVVGVTSTDASAVQSAAALATNAARELGGAPIAIEDLGKTKSKSNAAPTPSATAVRNRKKPDAVAATAARIASATAKLSAAENNKQSEISDSHAASSHAASSNRLRSAKSQSIDYGRRQDAARIGLIVLSALFVMAVGAYVYYTTRKR